MFDSVRKLLTSAHSVRIRDWQRFVLAIPLYRNPIGPEMSHMLHKADGDDGLGGSTDSGDRRLPVAPDRGHQSQPTVLRTERWWPGLTMAAAPERLQL